MYGGSVGFPTIHVKLRGYPSKYFGGVGFLQRSSVRVGVAVICALWLGNGLLKVLLGLASAGTYRAFSRYLRPLFAVVWSVVRRVFMGNRRIFCGSSVCIAVGGRRGGPFIRRRAAVTFSKVIMTDLADRLGRGLLGKEVSGVTRPRTSRLLLAIGSARNRCHLSVSTSTSLPLICLASGGGPDPVATPGFYVLLHGRVDNNHVISV